MRKEIQRPDDLSQKLKRKGKDNQVWFVIEDRFGWLLPDTASKFYSECKKNAEEKFDRPYDIAVKELGISCIKVKLEKIGKAMEYL